MNGAEAKTIRVDGEVWQALQRKAAPFEDTPNSVLRRMLGLDARKKRGRPAVRQLEVEQPPPKVEEGAGPRRRNYVRLPRGVRTREDFYERPILLALYELGGTGAKGKVLARVESMIGNKLNKVDRQALPTGGIRWENAAQWQRKHMVDKGLLRNHSPYGVWELTEEGIRAAEQVLAVRH